MDITGNEQNGLTFFSQLTSLIWTELSSSFQAAGNLAVAVKVLQIIFIGNNGHDHVSAERGFTNVKHSQPGRFFVQQLKVGFNLIVISQFSILPNSETKKFIGRRLS